VNAGEALERSRRELKAAGVETPDVDAEWLVAHVLGVPRSSLRLGDRELDRGREARLAEHVRDQPLAYVLGEWGFRRLTLRTDARALVPRPETEVVVDRCLALIAGLDAPRVLDVGTGSGAIALAIADEHPGARVVALDASADALALARENTERAGLGDRVDLVRGDLAEPLPGGPYDLLVSNPPYVAPEELDTLAPEVRDWEPRAAIVDTGQSELVERVALDVLGPGGALVLETHRDGARQVAKRLRILGYEAVTISRDLAGEERVVEGRRP
jgi:release factor glutamine methyltransferase